MIVIPRKKGQDVVIGEDIVITVIDVRGDKVRLGIELPKGTNLQRGEVYEASRSRTDRGDLLDFDA